MSWKVEVTTNNGINWATNAIRLNTEKEAVEYGTDLMMRWTSVTAFRAAESEDKVNYVWSSREGLQPLKE